MHGVCQKEAVGERDSERRGKDWGENRDLEGRIFLTLEREIQTIQTASLLFFGLVKTSET